MLDKNYIKNVSKRVMKLLPYAKFSIEVDQDINTVRSKLEPHVERFWSNGKVWGKKTTFEGQTSDTGFKLYRNLKYQNSFFPVFKGEYIECEQGTRINIQARMVLLINAFMMFFLGWMIWICTSSLFEGREFSFVPLIVLVFGWSFMCAGFWYEVPKTLRELKRVLE